jgi:hypothetical protein
LAFAPRAFWKNEGVKYVAWAGEQDPKTRLFNWDVRTIEEELSFAKKMG